MKTVLLALAVAPFLIFGDASAQPSPFVGAGPVQQLAQKILPHQKVVQIVRGQGFKVLDVRLDRGAGVYLVTARKRNGQLVVVTVDAHTGDVLNVAGRGS